MRTIAGNSGTSTHLVKRNRLTAIVAGVKEKIYQDRGGSQDQDRKPIQWTSKGHQPTNPPDLFVINVCAMLQAALITLLF